MPDLLKTLSSVRAGVALGDVMLLGAGSGDALDGSWGEQHAASRLTLVEGDAEAAAALERRASAWSRVTVVSESVASQAGPMPWNSWSLPRLDGPVDWEPLRRIYPRIARRRRTNVSARAVTDVFDQHLGEARTDAGQALLIDLPGQEYDLLQALGAERLSRLEFIVVRSCSALTSEVAPWLAAAGFETALLDTDSEPLWPTLALRRDPRLQALNLERARSADLAARNAALDAELADARQAMAGLRTLQDRAAAAEQGLAQARFEWAAREQAMSVAMADRTRELEAMAMRAKEQQANAAESQAALESRLQAAADQIASMEMARDALGVEAARSRETIEGLGRQLEEQEALLAKAHDERQGVVQSRAALESRLQAAADRIASMDVAREALVAEATRRHETIEALGRQLDEQVALLAKARDERQSAARLLTESAAQVQTLWQEKRELQDSLGQQQAELEDLRHRLGATAAEAQARRRSLESELAAAQSLSVSTSRVQQVEVELAAERERCAALEQRIAALEEQVQHQDLRQRMLRDELNKAEGQVDIVKTLLLADLGL